MEPILTKPVQNKTIDNFRCFETNFIKIGSKLAELLTSKERLTENLAKRLKMSKKNVFFRSGGRSFQLIFTKLSKSIALIN